MWIHQNVCIIFECDKSLTMRKEKEEKVNKNKSFVYSEAMVQELEVQ